MMQHIIALFREHFGHNIISRRKDFEYTPHSTDLTPLNAYVRGMVKNLILGSEYS